VTRFGTIPPEPAPCKALDVLAPKFRDAVARVLMRLDAQGHSAKIAESLRSDARQAWLYGFGRQYDDGRGIVTHAPNGNKGWHKFCLAVDIVHRDKEWNAPFAFWEALRDAAEAEGLTSGARWKMADLPHIHWGKCRVTPSEEAAALYAKGGCAAVWDAVGANA
jgi:hypothetical protein